jgi:hypothetical protein
VLQKGENSDILALQSTLNDFGILSGLNCNMEKTCIMPIGGCDTSNLVTNFTICNEIKLLGMEIDNNLECLNTIHNKTLVKISNTINFWSRFWLSLPGRITVFKTLCLSQLNYLGCIITPDDQIMDEISSLMEKFVVGKCKISRDRIYGKTKEGGLGMFRIEAFLRAQQVLWVKRALDACCDIWREDIYDLSLGNPSILCPTLVKKYEHPILFNIAVSFDKFKSKFFELNNNYKKSPLLLNPVIKRNRDDTRLLDFNFFSQIPVLNLENLAKLKFNDVFRDAPLLLDVINTNLDLNLNLNTFLRLAGACSNYHRIRLNRNHLDNDSSLELKDYFKTFKKGSGSIRKILCKSKPVELAKLRSVKTYLNITGIRDVNQCQLEGLHTLWTCNFLSNKVREFSSKFANNLLGLNTRVSHFVANINRGCNFCTLTGPDPPDETFLHLFYQCEAIKEIRKKYIEKFFPESGDNNELKKLIWFGFVPPQIKDKLLFLACIMLCQYGIWEAKQKNKLPSFHIVTKNAILALISLCTLSPTAQTGDDNFSLSRYWDRFCRDGVH